jgi:hypothetical protein
MVICINFNLSALFISFISILSAALYNQSLISAVILFGEPLGRGIFLLYLLLNILNLIVMWVKHLSFIVAIFSFFLSLKYFNIIVIAAFFAPFSILIFFLLWDSNYFARNKK